MTKLFLLHSCSCQTIQDSMCFKILGLTGEEQQPAAPWDPRGREGSPGWGVGWLAQQCYLLEVRGLGDTCLLSPKAPHPLGRDPKPHGNPDTLSCSTRSSVVTLGRPRSLGPPQSSLPGWFIFQLGLGLSPRALKSVAPPPPHPGEVCWISACSEFCPLLLQSPSPLFIFCCGWTWPQVGLLTLYAKAELLLLVGDVTGHSTDQCHGQSTGHAGDCASLCWHSWAEGGGRGTEKGGRQRNVEKTSPETQAASSVPLWFPQKPQDSQLTRVRVVPATILATTCIKDKSSQCPLWPPAQGQEWQPLPDSLRPLFISAPGGFALNTARPASLCLPPAQAEGELFIFETTVTVHWEHIVSWLFTRSTAIQQGKCPLQSSTKPHGVKVSRWGTCQQVAELSSHRASLTLNANTVGPVHLLPPVTSYCLSNYRTTVM